MQVFDLIEVRKAGHPSDPDACCFHNTITPQWPHSHEIIEDWSPRDKQRLANHIDMWHAPKEDELAAQ
jgi:hypothetical protein